MVEFIAFPKIPRLSRNAMILTEKLDGTNASIHIGEDGLLVGIGSRNRWITPEDDNYGFARWAMDNKEELLQLGPGAHYGEWWGNGIQRGYGKKEKTFSLFNTGRWSNGRPTCCDVVPLLYTGMFDTAQVDVVLADLASHGSYAAEGFMDPEGIIIYHSVGRHYYKKTLDGNDGAKGEAA